MDAGARQAALDWLQQRIVRLENRAADIAADSPSLAQQDRLTARVLAEMHTLFEETAPDRRNARVDGADPVA